MNEKINVDETPRTYQEFAAQHESNDLPEILKRQAAEAEAKQDEAPVVL